MMYKTTKPYTKKVIDLIKQTWNNCPHICSVKDGMYPAVKLKSNTTIVDHTDGIGTKGFYHWKAGSFKSAAIDAFAMNINDLSMISVKPFKMQNHIFIPKDNDNAIYEIVSALVELANEHKIVMTGGETSIHNNMDGMDISITMSGTGEGSENVYQENDILVGLPSSGLHSNGFTKVRERLTGFRDEFIEPTKIYPMFLVSCLNSVHHITGGAFAKIKPFIKDVDLRFEFNKKPNRIFYDLFNSGIPSEEMYKTFNCGYGFVLGVNERYLDFVLKKTAGDVIGKITKGTGEIHIKSAFDDKWITF